MAGARRLQALKDQARRRQIGSARPKRSLHLQISWSFTKIVACGPFRRRCKIVSDRRQACAQRQRVDASPVSDDARVENLVARLTAGGIALDDLYVDPLVFPLATDPYSGKATLVASPRYRLLCATPLDRADKSHQIQSIWDRNSLRGAMEARTIAGRSRGRAVSSPSSPS